MELSSLVRGDQSRHSQARQMIPFSGPVSIVFAVMALTGCVGPHVAPQAKQDAPAVAAGSEPAADPLEAPRAATPPTASPVPLPPMIGAGSEETARQDEVPVVEASTRESYTVSNSTAATKTDTPIQETPVSVQTIPRAVIDDQKTPRLRDALENISGVRTNQSLGGGSGFVIRGFFDSFRVYRNGLLATSPSFFQSDWDTANIERVEVLKGPASILYGRIEPGGWSMS